MIFFKTKLKYSNGHFEQAYGIVDESRMNVYIQLNLDYEL